VANKAPSACIVCFPDPCECGPKPKKKAPRFKAPPAQGTPAGHGETEGRNDSNGPVREAFDPTALDTEHTVDRWAKQAAVRSDLDIALDALVPIMHTSELDRYGKHRTDGPSPRARDWRAKHGEAVRTIT
jgi:hypothetical protein